MINSSNEQLDEHLLSRYPLKALKELHSPRSGQKLGRWLLLFLMVGILVLFLPWRQNIDGQGTISALTPKDRPQAVQNAIGGQIESWRVEEGDFVKKGDTLLVLSEVKDEYFDPELPVRLDEQLAAKRMSLGATQAKISALEEQMNALRAGREVKLASIRNKIRQGVLKVTSDSTDLIAVRKGYQIARDRLERYELGYRDGLFSLTDLESRRLKIQEDQAKVIAQENKLGVARQELLIARLETESTEADYREKSAKALSDKSSALSYQADATGEISKLRNKASSVDIRRGHYIVRAPQDGYVVRSLKAGIGETIKEGESIVILQPAQPNVAVELYVRAMDIPLIQPGRMVRLQFDGWPALQFVGWPMVSVGTFGGEVVNIDAVSSANGRYRILVSPKAANRDAPWPPQLRVGSGVHGWVMLDDVPIWYELWRLFNGFPPSLQEEPKDKKEK